MLAQFSRYKEQIDTAKILPRVRWFPPEGAEDKPALARAVAGR
jgi:hypothetical protein